MKLASVITLALALAFCAFGQSPTPNPVTAPPTATTASASFLSQMLDPLTISAAAYDLSQVASGATAWKFAVNGRTYNVSAAQKTGIAAAATVGAAAIAHRWPKLRTPLTIVLAAMSAYYGGMAYANAQNHGAAATAPAVASTTAHPLQETSPVVDFRLR